MKVSGSSMTPYIQDGDEVSFDENLIPSSGNLVLCRLEGETFIHRYCPSGRVKGDNNLAFDWEDPNNNQILGVVTHRIEKNQRIPLGDGFLQRMIAFLSENNLEGVPVRKFSRVLIILLGNVSRFLKF